MLVQPQPNTVKVQARNASPSLKICINQHHTCGLLVFIQYAWNPLCTDLTPPYLFQQNAKHAYCGYSHVCCNCCSCYAAVFLRHSTNMLHNSHLSWLQAHHCKQHLFHLPPTTNGVHPPANSSKLCDMIAQPFMHQITTLSWCFPKQEMKSSYMRNFLSVILSPFSAASEGTNKSFTSPLPNINTVATQETFQVTRYDQHTVTTVRLCVSLSKWFLMF